MEVNNTSRDLPAHLADIVRASNAAITSVSAELRIQSWNPGAEKLFGFTSEEMVGADLMMILPEDRRKEAREFSSRVQAGEILSVETVCRHKTGRLLEVSIALTPMPDPEGRMAGVCAVMHDITDRRKALEELEKTRAELEDRVGCRTAELAAATAAARETAHRFETLIENSPLPIISLDVHARVLLWNPAAERLFGWRQADVLGQLVPNLPQENRERYEAELRAMVTSPEHLHWETQRQRKDGSLLEVAIWRAPLFDADHELSSSMAILMDITERKFLERALLEATERESRRIGQELHDHLCQHLLGAAFSSKAISTGLPADLPAAAELNDLARLINSAVQQTRDIARGLNPVELDSGGLMAALQELTERPYPGITCRLECQRPVLLPDAKAALHVYRIAQEAVANAVQHSRGTEIVVRLTEDEENVDLQIADNGSGFARMQTGEQQGLGLKIMKYRAQAIGGKLWVDTTKDGGTLVICVLPKRNDYAFSSRF
jgi:PAS domain S-box-containing protein